MATTSPARIDDDLYASAKLAGEVQSRSTSQQVVHWARIGREIEASAAISQRDIAEVLAGSRSYDGLSAKEQALVRAEWSTRMDDLRASLDLARQFEAADRTWVELDDDGAVVERHEAGPTRTPATPAPPAKRAKKPARTTTTGTAAPKNGKAPASTTPLRTRAAKVRTRSIG
jgi:hypothetical protein